jgi:hypothetical protein
VRELLGGPVCSGQGVWTHRGAAWHSIVSPTANHMMLRSSLFYRAVKASKRTRNSQVIHFLGPSEIPAAFECLAKVRSSVQQAILTPRSKCLA